MESIIGLYKAECIDTDVFHVGPDKSLGDVEYATAGWADWYNNRRLHSSLGLPPADRVRTSPLRCPQTRGAASMRAAQKPGRFIPDDRTRVLRRQVTRRAHLVRQRTRIKNQVHAILARNLAPTPPVSDLFGGTGRHWLSMQPLPADERSSVQALLRQLDFHGAELAVVDKELAVEALADPVVARWMTIPGVNAIAGMAIVAAVGDFYRLPDADRLVAYVGLNPKVRQSGNSARCTVGSAKAGRAQARGVLGNFTSDAHGGATRSNPQTSAAPAATRRRSVRLGSDRLAIGSCETGRSTHSRLIRAGVPTRHSQPQKAVGFSTRTESRVGSAVEAASRGDPPGLGHFHDAVRLGLPRGF